MVIKRNKEARADTVVVLDFETSGLSPDNGDRPIEVGAVRIEEGTLTGRFQMLMNPGFRINSLITQITGINNHMLKDAPGCAEVMREFADFLKTDNLIAHNASFDRRFLDTELKRINRNYPGEFACSLLISRRLYQEIPNHQLETLIKYKNIPSDGQFHRALADSEMTAKLWLRMLLDIEEKYGLKSISLGFMQQLGKQPKKHIHSFLCKSGKG